MLGTVRHNALVSSVCPAPCCLPAGLANGIFGFSSGSSLDVPEALRHDDRATRSMCVAEFFLDGSDHVVSRISFTRLEQLRKLLSYLATRLVNT